MATDFVLNSMEEKAQDLVDVKDYFDSHVNNGHLSEDYTLNEDYDLSYEYSGLRFHRVRG